MSSCANGIIQAFVNDPAGSPDTSCVDTSAIKFLGKSDIIAIPALRNTLASAGLFGLLLFGAENLPGLLAALFLLTAVPVLFNRLAH